MLAEGDALRLSDLTAVLELAPSTVSQHLFGALPGEGFSPTVRSGKLVFYRLREDGAAAALLPPLLALFAEGYVAGADRAVVARLRLIPIATICAAELTGLAAIDVRKAVAS